MIVFKVPSSHIYMSCNMFPCASKTQTQEDFFYDYAAAQKGFLSASPSYPSSATSTNSQTVHFKKNSNGELGSLVWAACQNDQSAVAAKYGHGASCGPTYFARHRYFMHRHTRAHSTTHVRGGECVSAHSLHSS